MNEDSIREDIEEILSEETGDYFPVIYHETDLIGRLVEYIENTREKLL
jgi:hypothetical protein